VEDIGTSDEDQDEAASDPSTKVEADEDTASESSHTSPDEELVEPTE